MSDRLHKALLGMTDPARRLADALEEYRTGGPQFVTSVHGDTFEVEPDPLPRQVVVNSNAKGYAARTIVDPAHAHLLIYVSPIDIMKDLQQQADELLHAIDLARNTITGAIPLQTLDLVRVKVKDVVGNIAGTIEKDL